MPKLKYLKLNYSTNEKKIKNMFHLRKLIYMIISLAKSKKAIEEDE